MSLRKDILQYLLKNRDHYSSGEQLAKQFDVSRTAVWKAVQALRKDGYTIVSLTNQGYKLTDITDRLDESLIRMYANNYTNDIIVLESVPSTNDFAKELVLKGATDGTLIVADYQSAGRGRQGHSFYSPAGSGVYFTIILRPRADLRLLLKTTLAAAVSVCEGIECCTDKIPQIKWVNDVFIDKKKVCGILTEATSDFESQQVDSIIVGIGINCTEAVFPPELSDIAGSLSRVNVNRNELVAYIYTALLRWKEYLDTQLLLNAYRSRSLLIGREITYVQNKQKYTGYVVGINDDGNLEIQQNNGNTIQLQSGEVSVKDWTP